MPIRMCIVFVHIGSIKGCQLEFTIFKCNFFCIILDL